MMNNMTYKPLPDDFTIKKSSIDGLGLFATKLILKGSIFGPTHIHDKRFKDNFIRTPLGGFINHSDQPNVSKINSKDSRDIDTDLILIEVIKDIQADEEIFLKYDLYKLT